MIEKVCQALRIVVGQRTVVRENLEMGSKATKPRLGK